MCVHVRVIVLYCLFSSCLSEDTIGPGFSIIKIGVRLHRRGKGFIEIEWLYTVHRYNSFVEHKYEYFLFQMLYKRRTKFYSPSFARGNHAQDLRYATIPRYCDNSITHTRHRLFSAFETFSAMILSAHRKQRS